MLKDLNSLKPINILKWDVEYIKSNIFGLKKLK